MNTDQTQIQKMSRLYSDLVPAEIQENANLQTGRFQHMDLVSCLAQS